MTDWIFDNMGWVFLALLGLVVGLLVLAENDARAEFMHECIEARPQYECTAMWRSAQPQVQVVPVPMIIR